MPCKKDTQNLLRVFFCRVDVTGVLLPRGGPSRCTIDLPVRARGPGESRSYPPENVSRIPCDPVLLLNHALLNENPKTVVSLIGMSCFFGNQAQAGALLRLMLPRFSRISDLSVLILAIRLLQAYNFT